MKRIVPFMRTLRMLASKIALAGLLCALMHDGCLSGGPDHEELTGKCVTERAGHGAPASLRASKSRRPINDQHNSGMS
jgi:hypothetical protein